MNTWLLDGKTVQVFPGAAPGCPLVLVNTFAEAVAPLQKALQEAPDHTLVVVTGIDWEGDLSPWAAEALNEKSAPFAGGASAYLHWLECKVLPQVEAQLAAPPCWRGLAGYSLAGLCAVYALYNSVGFARVASMSGSLWFEGFRDYALTTPLMQVPQCVYFSLGDKEKKTRHPLMRSVQENTEAIAAHFQHLGVATTVVLESGGHFKDAAARTARGISWLLAQ